MLGAFATLPRGDYLEQPVADTVTWDKPIHFSTMEDMAKFNVSGRLSQINVPTLVTWNDKDIVIPFEGIVDVFTKRPNRALEVWHGVGHSESIEFPNRFRGLLTQFVDEINLVLDRNEEAVTQEEGE